MDPFQAEKLDQIIKLLKQIAEQTSPRLLRIDYEPYQLNTVPHSPDCQLKKAELGWWSITPPACTCGAGAYTTGSTTYYAGNRTETDE